MRIPRTLDRPTRLLGVPFDLVVVCATTYYVFVLFECGMFGFPVSIIVTHIYSRARTQSLFRKMGRFIYWYFPAELTKTQGIPSHMRRIRFKKQTEK